MSRNCSAAGIDVWTTLNIQHLESLVDVIWKITGVRVRETVPDFAISAADEIEVVDITPDELRERLSAGKVYVPETARQAADNFFKPENLTALRELALRRVAQTVDDQLVGAMRQTGDRGALGGGRAHPGADRRRRDRRLPGAHRPQIGRHDRRPMDRRPCGAAEPAGAGRRRRPAGSPRR